MQNTDSPETHPNWLYSLSLRRPGLVMLVLFILACVIKILDSFVLRLDELLGEAILTKGLGFVLLAAYVWICGRRLRDIGFKSRFAGKALLISAVCFISLYVVAFGAQLIVLRAGGEDARLAFSAVDFKTGMTGGLFFGIWLLLANFVNSAMEEGLFRGAMLRHFRRKLSFWGATFLGAGYFSIWHITGPIKNLMDGKVDLGGATFEAFFIMLGTFVAGIVYGYLYLKTDNLWGPFLAHTLNNSIFNVLFIQTSAGMQSGLEFVPFQIIFLLGNLALIPLIGLFARRWDLPEVEPWG
jgi:membrane protease YdiL (CAAX protease family)